MRILLVEDNVRLRELVTVGLKAGGFAVDGVSDIEGAEAALAAVGYAAMIMDLGLPDGDGIDLLRRIRANGGTLPILILTARDGVEDRVRGLDGGADDYLLKPFAMEELQARVRALMRRPGSMLGSVLICGNVALDTASREVLIDNQAVTFPRRETDLLERLMRRPNRVVPKRALEDGLYGFEDDASANSIEAIISRLRKRLAQSNAAIVIHTLRGVGYMLDEQA